MSLSQDQPRIMSSASVARVGADVAATKAALSSALLGLAERGEKLSALAGRAEALTAATADFEKAAGRVGKAAFWARWKWTVAVVGVVAVVGALAGLAGLAKAHAHARDE